jgi:hypothetical protein
MKISRAFTNFTCPGGTIDFSPIINVPTNGFHLLIPNTTNTKIKRISAYCRLGTNTDIPVITFYNIRFRIVNRDISLQNNLAGNILNPISGPWNGSLPKDSIVDVMLSSKKNYIEFSDSISAGGIQFQTVRLKFFEPLPFLITIAVLFNIEYE